MKNNLVGLIFGIVTLVFFAESTNAQWVQISKGAIAPITSLVIIDSQIFAATLNNGIYFSTDNGANWTAINLGLPASPANNINCLAVNGSNIFAGTSANMVFILPKNGTSWTATDSNLGGSVLFLAVNGSTVFAGTYGRLFFSTDNGASWTEDNSGLGINSVLSFAVKGSNIFIGTSAGGVFTTPGTGTGWTNVNSELSHSTVLCLAVSGNKIFAGVTPPIYNSPSAKSTSASDSVGMESGVYFSSDNCTTWTAVNSGLSIGSMVYCFAVYGNYIFAGTSSGVFLFNNGTNWTNVGSAGLPNSVTCLVTTGNTIFAGTNQGVFRRPLSEMTRAIKSQPQPVKMNKINLQIRRRNNYNDRMSIEFSLPYSNKVVMKIYNLSGHEITSLVNEYLSSGPHSICWDTRHVPEGCYIARMQAGLNDVSGSVSIIR